MKIPLPGLDVWFPYETIYPEQLQFITELQNLLDRGKHGLMEMPCGTGKTISLLSILVSWKIKHKDDVGKVIYCTRTTGELEKVLQELQNLMVYIMENSDFPEPPILGVGLAARSTLCVNSEVRNSRTSTEIDAACFARTTTWDSAEGGAIPDIEDIEGPRCSYFDASLSDGAPANPLPKGVYTLDSLIETGKDKHHCPYWLARWALDSADVVVLSYPYTIDPKVAEHITAGFPSSSVVVYDEAHNIDNVCMDALTYTITRASARAAREEAKKLLKIIKKCRDTDSAALQAEYNALVSENQTAGYGTGAPVEDLVPGNMRKAEHFAGMLRRLTDYFNDRFAKKTTRIEVQTPQDALSSIKDHVLIQSKQLVFAADRLRLLLRTLKEVSDGFANIQLMVHLVTTLATYAEEGFRVVYEPEEASSANTHWDSAYSLICCDASIGMRNIFQKYRNVLLTSGTLSPLEMYENMLGFAPTLKRSLKPTFVRPCAYPLILSRGADQQSLQESHETTPLSTSYRTRVSSQNPEVVRNYGSFLVELCQVVPDGVVCFFTSYRYMEEVLSTWDAIGLLSELTKQKLIFIETKSITETEAALSNFRTACDVGRGGLFMSIARGKVAEGIDFDGHYGRAVVIFGVPYLPPDDQALNVRLQWMEENKKIPQQTYRAFDAMRQSSQCMGRVLRNKKDYGMMILADKRYLSAERRDMLPTWLLEAGLSRPEHLNLSADVAINLACRWLTTMAQPTNLEEELGISLYSADNVAGIIEAKYPVITKAKRAKVDVG